MKAEILKKFLAPDRKKIVLAIFLIFLSFLITYRSNDYVTVKSPSGIPFTGAPLPYFTYGTILISAPPNFVLPAEFSFLCEYIVQ